MPPTAALIAAAGAGARRRALFAFFIASFGVTVIVGVALGTSVERIVMAVSQSLVIPDALRAWLQVAAAGGLAGWATRRIQHKPDHTEQKRPSTRGTSTGAMTITGILWGVAALIDPTFYGAAALTARVDVLSATLLIALWFVISQLPLCVVTVALVRSADRALVDRIVAVFTRVTRAAAPVLTVTIAVGALVLLANAATYLVAGSFWPL